MVIGLDHQCSCYFFHHGDRLYSLHISNYRCNITAEGSLVAMETEEEWKFIKTQIQKRTTGEEGANEWYVGLEWKEGVWKWPSGQNLTYSKWLPGQPDEHWTKGCAVISETGLFKTMGDHYRKGRICEKKTDVTGNGRTHSVLGTLWPRGPLGHMLSHMSLSF